MGDAREAPEEGGARGARPGTAGSLTVWSRADYVFVFSSNFLRKRKARMGRLFPFSDGTLGLAWAPAVAKDWARVRLSTSLKGDPPGAAHPPVVGSVTGTAEEFG